MANDDTKRDGASFRDSMDAATDAGRINRSPSTDRTEARVRAQEMQDRVDHIREGHASRDTEAEPVTRSRRTADETANEPVTRTTRSAESNQPDTGGPIETPGGNTSETGSAGSRTTRTVPGTPTSRGPSIFPRGQTGTPPPGCTQTTTGFIAMIGLVLYKVLRK